MEEGDPLREEMLRPRLLLGLPQQGWAIYLVATKTVAGIHDERLLSMVLLTHIQALVDTEVLYLQNGEQRGKPA